jgi:hypothetical protein
MRIPVATIIRASDPDAKTTLYLDEICSASKRFDNDEIEMFLAMRVKKMACQRSAKMRLEPPVAGFVWGASNPEHLWTIAVNDL